MYDSLLCHTTDELIQFLRTELLTCEQLLRQLGERREKLFREQNLRGSSYPSEQNRAIDDEARDVHSRKDQTRKILFFLTGQLQ